MVGAYVALFSLTMAGMPLWAGGALLHGVLRRYRHAHRARRLPPPARQERPPYLPAHYSHWRKHFPPKPCSAPLWLKRQVLPQYDYGGTHCVRRQDYQRYHHCDHCHDPGYHGAASAPG